MSYSVEIRDTFRESIDEIYTYHEKRKSGEGSDILEAVWDKIEALELNPQMYQIRYDDIRVAPVKVKHFQYHIIYRIIPPKVIAIVPISTGRAILNFSTNQYSGFGGFAEALAVWEMQDHVEC